MDSRSRGATGLLMTWAVLAGLLGVVPGALAGQEGPGQEARATLDIPLAARASADFDPRAATDAYLATVPAEARARSDAYYEGGYWLRLWNVLLSAGIFVLLLAVGWSARMRDLAEQVTRWHGVHVMVYWALFSLVVALLSFPLTVYESFFREHEYGLSTLTFGAWLSDVGKAQALSLIFGGLFAVVIYKVLRRAPRTWWIWASGVSLAFFVLGSLIAPVFIAPLFNTYTTLDDPEVSAPILSLARANGIPASQVYMVDASRQTTRVSANVSGFLGTERVTLNDNLLNRATLPEIEAVMGHEMGHYVLNHVYKMLIFMAVLLVTVFAVLYRVSSWAVDRWGERWGVRGVDDVAGLPLLALVFGLCLTVLTPVLNSWIRVQEAEADMFGLNAARQPDGMALISLKLGEYRKLDPGHWEEIIFFDHPSGRARIFASMRWKAENLGEVP